MFGVLITAIAASFEEIGSSIGKAKINSCQASCYTVGFLNLIGGTVLIATIGLIRDSFVFSLESLPTFIPRLILEMILMDLTMRALARADRSTFGFIRTTTIPLLLVDFRGQPSTKSL